jgi:hypothetical protein
MSIQNNTKHFKTFIAILIFGLGFFNNVSAQTTVDCSGNPLWLPGSIYSSPLTKVVYNGVQYQNKWWTQGNQPDLFLDVTSNQTDGSKHWILLGTCTPGTTTSAVVPNYWTMNDQTTFLNTIPSVTRVNINTPLSNEPSLNTTFYSFNVKGRTNFIADNSGDDNIVSIWSGTKSNTTVGNRRQYLSFHNAVYADGKPYGIIGSNSFKLGASPETQVTDLILQPAGGKVGIGAFTTSPEATLHVNGDIMSSSNMTVGNYLLVNGSDITLGLKDCRYKGIRTGQRALVHFGEDVCNSVQSSVTDLLIINYAGDFESGVEVQSKMRVYGDLILPSSTNLKFSDGSTVVSYWNKSNNDINYLTGNIGIGTTDTKGYKLAVNGNIIATAVRVKPFGNWPDYVFESDYNLRSIEDVDKFIKLNKHLPGIPSASEMATKDLDIAEMNALLLQKTEELMLYIIELKKEVQELKNKQ